MLRNFRRLFRTLLNNPARIKEGPEWLRRQFYIWRRRRRGTSGYLADVSSRDVFLGGRLRYDHLRVAVVGNPATFPELEPEALPSPDAGLDLVFSEGTHGPPIDVDRIERAGGFHCISTEPGWECRKVDDSVIVAIDSRPNFDHRAFNPMGRRVDTALISTHDPKNPMDVGELKKLAAVRIPSALASEDQVSIAIRVLACGTPVVLDPGSPALRLLRGAGVIEIPEAAPLTVGRLGFDQPFAYERASAAASRFAFWEFSSLFEADRLVSQLGFHQVGLPSVSVALVTRRPQLLVGALESIDRQNYPHLELVVGIHTSSAPADLIGSVASMPNVSTVVAYESTTPFGEVLDATVERCSGRLIAKMDDDDWYSEDHLADLVAAWLLTRADVIGKTSNFAYLEESDRTLGYDDELQHRRVEHIPGGTMLATKDLLVDYKFGRSSRAVDSVLLRKVRADRGYLYSTTRQGFMRRRYRGHTAGFDDDWFVRRAHGRTLPGLRLDLAGIAPVHEAQSPSDVHHGQRGDG